MLRVHPVWGHSVYVDTWQSENLRQSFVSGLPGSGLPDMIDPCAVLWVEVRPWQGRRVTSALDAGISAALIFQIQRLSKLVQVSLYQPQCTIMPTS